MIAVGIIILGFTVFLAFVLNYFIRVKNTNAAGVLEVNGLLGYLGHYLKASIATVFLFALFAFGGLFLVRGFSPQLDQYLNDPKVVHDFKEELPASKVFFKLSALVNGQSVPKGGALTHYITNAKPTFFENRRGDKIARWTGPHAGRCISIDETVRNNRLPFEYIDGMRGPTTLYVSEDDVRPLPLHVFCDAKTKHIDLTQVNFGTMSNDTITPTHVIKSEGTFLKQGPDRKYANVDIPMLSRGTCLEIIGDRSRSWAEVRVAQGGQTYTGFVKNSRPLLAQLDASDTKCQ